MSRTRWFDIAAIALTVAVLTGVGLVLRPHETATVKVSPSFEHRGADPDIEGTATRS